MTRIELLQQHRKLIAENYSLRAKIGIDIDKNERTIQRWAVGNSPNLCSDTFIKSLKKHSGLSGKLTEKVKIKQLLEH